MRRVLVKQKLEEPKTTVKPFFLGVSENSNSKFDLLLSILKNFSSLEDVLSEVKLVFSKIKQRFNNYLRIFSTIIASYLVFFVIWIFVSGYVARGIFEFKRYLGPNWGGISEKNYKEIKEAKLNKKCPTFFKEGAEKLNIGSWWQMSATVIILGSLYILDGVVTSFLKSPFGQLCYSINNNNFMEYKEKDDLIELMTSAIEIPKETLKKFGILAVSGGVVEVFLNLNGLLGEEQIRTLPLYLAYMIPILVSGYQCFLARNLIGKIENNLIEKLKIADEKIKKDKIVVYKK